LGRSVAADNGVVFSVEVGNDSVLRGSFAMIVDLRQSTARGQRWSAWEEAGLLNDDLWWQRRENASSVLALREGDGECGGLCCKLQQEEIRYDVVEKSGMT
jgi:hypothetical protein